MLKPGKPLRVAVLSTFRSPGVRDLLADPARGSLWEISGALATEPDFADAPLFEAAGIPVIHHPIRRFYRQRGRRITDLPMRREYDKETAQLLRVFRPDLLLLSSYLYILTDPMLEAFPARIVNVHGSDLTRLDASGRPRFLGLQAVADAIFAGERETRATAHWVTDGVDLGPPILRSRPFPVSPLAQTARIEGDIRMLKAYAFAHQEWMLHEAWGRLLKGVLRLAVTGRIAAGDRTERGPRPLLWDLSEQGGLCQTNQAVRPLAVC